MRQAGLRVPCGPLRNQKCGIPKAIPSRPSARGKALYRWFMNFFRHVPQYSAASNEPSELFLQERTLWDGPDGIPACGIFVTER